MTHQLDLFEKPYHAITVYRMPVNGNGRSHVVRYDTLELMMNDCERTFDISPLSSNIAYIQLCERWQDDKGNYRVKMLDTVRAEDYA